MNKRTVNVPLTPALSLKGRGNSIVLVVVGCCILLGAGSVAQAETWQCTRPDGSVIYSDQNLGGKCRSMDELPPLMRTPSSPFDDAKPKETPPSSQEAEPVPTPGRGRRIDPPGDAAITIRDLKAIPNFNSLLGVAQYQATMQLENGDSNWTAEKVCINVRFQDFSFIFLDVNQVGCMDSLKPSERRVFTVTYTGLIPPRLFPIRAEATVEFVKWTK